MPHFIRTWKRNARQRLWQAMAFYVSLSLFLVRHLLIFPSSEHSTSLQPFPVQHISISCQKLFKYAFSKVCSVMRPTLSICVRATRNKKCHDARNRSRNKGRGHGVQLSFKVEGMCTHVYLYQPPWCREPFTALSDSMCGDTRKGLVGMAYFGKGHCRSVLSSVVKNFLWLVLPCSTGMWLQFHSGRFSQHYFTIIT